MQKKLQHRVTWHMALATHHAVCVKVHYNDVIMSAMASQFTSVTIVCSTVCSGVTGTLWGDTTVPGELPYQLASNVGFDISLVLVLRNYWKKQLKSRRFETPCLRHSHFNNCRHYIKQVSKLKSSILSERGKTKTWTQKIHWTCLNTIPCTFSAPCDISNCENCSTPGVCMDCKVGYNLDNNACKRK